MDSKLLRIAAMVAGLVVAGCSAADRAAADPASPRFYLGGIQVNESDHERWLDALQAAGMNTVSVTDYARQGDWDTDHLWWDEDRGGVLSEIRAAKRRDLAVVLILRVALDHAFERNDFLWHGMIMPKTDRLVESWFERYARFALGWAEIAEREGVDVLMIGSEMNALGSTVPLAELPALEEYYLNPEKQADRKAELLRHEAAIEDRPVWLREREEYPDLEAYLEARLATERSWAVQVAAGGNGAALERINRRRRLLEREWRGLIARLRAVYRGRLGYAANFDQYRMATFWPQLDVMGINAYFKLRDRPLPPGSERLFDDLRSGWRGVLAGIEEFRAAQGVPEMPVIFTEIGYTYRLNSTLEPWNDAGFSLIKYGGPEGPEEELVVWREQPEAPLERALAVRALWQAHRELGSPLLEGLLYWKLSTIPSHRDIESFVVILGEAEEDPLLPELRRFVGLEGGPGSPLGAAAAARSRGSG